MKNTLLVKFEDKFYIGKWINYTILYHLFQKICVEGTWYNLFYEASITLVTKPYKVITKEEKYRPIFLMNIDTKILKKILLTSWIQLCTKRVVY